MCKSYSSTMAREQPQRAAGGHTVEAILAATVLISFFDTFALLPVLPVYARFLGGEAWHIGVAVGIYSLAGLLMQVVGGYSADAFGRKGPLVLSLFGAAAALGLYGIAPSVEWLILLRAFHGATGAFFLPALFALVGEQAGERRAEALGRTGATIGLAAIVAPPAGGFVSRQWGAPWLFFGIAFVMAIMAVLVWRYVPETLQKLAEPSLRRLPEVVRVGPLRAAYVLTAAFTFCMGTLAYGFPLLVVERGYTTATAGVLLGWMALIAVPVMAFYRLGHPLGRALLGLGLMAGCMGALWWIRELWLLAAAMGVYGIGFGLLFPALHLVVFEHAPVGLRGSAFALLYLCYSGGLIAGSLTSGAIAGSVPPGLIAAALAGTAVCAVSLWSLRERIFRWAPLER